MSSPQLSENDRPSTAMPQSSTKSGFRVRVQIHFESPLDSDYSRDYDASPKFVASDQVCQGLFSRLQHCSTELITRHDYSALDPLTKPSRDPKQLRYRISFRVERDGACIFDKLLRSFQEQPLSSDEAREVVGATDRIVALFLLRHDPGFRWVEPAEPDSAVLGPETVRPCTGRPQSTYCVPRARFLHATQSHEFIPGYSIEVFLRSRCSTRYPESRNASLKIDSTQTTPLTILCGEDLMSNVTTMLDVPIDAWKKEFDQKHQSCEGLEGSGGCQHIEDGAVDIMFKVRNNLGPDYTYFSHRVQTSKVLFNDPQARDFDDYTEKLRAKLERARDSTDRAMASKDDLIIRIRDLRGENWQSQDHMVFRLDSTVIHCRQTTDALMERLYTGISSVFEGHDISATMLAHKRGHLIFDGVIGGYKDEHLPHEKFETPELEKKTFESRLKDRIRSDITMVCKDTCSLDGSDELPNLTVNVGGCVPSIKEPYSIYDVNVPESPTSSRHSSHGLAKKHSQGNLREKTLAPKGEKRPVPAGVEMAKQYGYMADYMADDENLSESPSTPSLTDTDSTSHHDNIVSTPQRSTHQGNTWLRMVGHNDPDAGLMEEDAPEHQDEEDVLRMGHSLATPTPKLPQELPEPSHTTQDEITIHDEDTDVDSIAAPSIHDSIEEAAVVEAAPTVQPTPEVTPEHSSKPTGALDQPEKVESSERIDSIQPEELVEPIIELNKIGSLEAAIQEPLIKEDLIKEEKEEHKCEPETPVEEVLEATNVVPASVESLDSTPEVQPQVPHDTHEDDDKPEQPVADFEGSESPVWGHTELPVIQESPQEDDLRVAPVNEEDSAMEVEEPATGSKTPVRTQSPNEAGDLSLDFSSLPPSIEDSPLVTKPSLPSFAENKRQATDEALLESAAEVTEVAAISRPLKTAPVERPKSTALTIRTYSNPFFTTMSRPGTSDSEDDRPKSAVSMSSVISQHVRQFSPPSAGFLGLNSPRHLDIGLRSVVVPYHLRAMHGDSRPSSSHSNQC